MKPQADKVAEQEAAVAKFLEEHQPLLEDSEIGCGAAQRILQHTLNVLTGVVNHLTDTLEERTRAAELLSAAMRDPHCSAGEVGKREKEYGRLNTESYRLELLQKWLQDFQAEVEAVRQGFDEDGNRITELPNAQQMRRIGEEEGRKMTEGMLEELSKGPAAPSPVPLWKRLLGVHQEETPENFKRLEITKSLSWWSRLLGINTPAQVTRRLAQPHEGSPEPREWLTTPSLAISDREDYEKLLTWYEQNLEVLEKAVAGRQSGEPGDWQQVIDELLDRMGWCDRHMDTIEGRNADMAGSELVERREGLASRRAELGE